MKSLKETIMQRDSLSSDEADELIKEAQKELFNRVSRGDTESAYDICQEYFGLEPDYLMNLM